MPFEELTTIQTVAEEFTDVASATNVLLDTYNIQQSDIEAYDVEPFGQNKFLISIIYLFRISEIFWANLGLTPFAIETLSTWNRTIGSVKEGLKVSAISTLTALQRTLKPTLGLKNLLDRLLVISRAFAATSITLTVALENYETIGKRPFKTPIALIVKMVQGLHESSRIPEDTLVGLTITQIQAWYNGLPIEE